MTDLLAARSQMAMSLGFHIVFAALGIAMPLMIAVAEWRWIQTGDKAYQSVAKRWSKGTAILFAVGAVSGTVLSFELGLLWPTFMEQAGPVIGPLFALEGFAFFAEAIFLGIYLYGWSRISPKAHLLCGIMVAAAGMASAVFVVTVNAWMNQPTGFRLEGRSMVDVHPMATLGHPLAWHEISHMLLAAFGATGFLVAGIHAFLLLRGSHSEFQSRALRTALAVGILPALAQPLSGDLIAKRVAVDQPAKLAAMEALFFSKAGADLIVGGIPDTEAKTVPYGIVIPHGLSLLLAEKPNAVITGLDHIPRSEWPPVIPVHWAFQIMVGCGFLMAAVAAWSGWSWWKGRLEVDGVLHWALVSTAPLGFIAIEAGWIVTEVGRQPWIIDHVMRTSEAITPMPGLWIPMMTFSVLYLLLAGVVVWAMWRHVAGTVERTWSRELITRKAA